MKLQPCKYVYHCTQKDFLIICSSVEEIYKDENIEGELEKIFSLLVDCTKVSTLPVNSSPLQSPTPIQPADRCVNHNVQINPQPLFFVASCILLKTLTIREPRMDTPRAGTWL